MFINQDKMGELLANKIKKNKRFRLYYTCPNTSKPVALALSDLLNIKYRAIIKNRYVNRTFIRIHREKSI